MSLMWGNHMKAIIYNNVMRKLFKKKNKAIHWNSWRIDLETSWNSRWPPEKLRQNSQSVHPPITNLSSQSVKSSMNAKVGSTADALKTQPRVLRLCHGKLFLSWFVFLLISSMISSPNLMLNKSLGIFITRNTSYYVYLPEFGTSIGLWAFEAKASLFQSNASGLLKAGSCLESTLQLLRPHPRQNLRWRVEGVEGLKVEVF